MNFNNMVNLAYKASEKLDKGIRRVDDYIIENVEKKVFGKPLNNIIDPQVDKAINISEKYIRLALDKVSKAIDERTKK